MYVCASDAATSTKAKFSMASKVPLRPPTGAMLLLRLPLVERLDVNLRIADYYARTTLTNILNAATYTSPRETQNSSTLLLGLGASYRVVGHWSARFDYLRIEHAGDSKTLKYNVSIMAVGASYTF